MQKPRSLLLLILLALLGCHTYPACERQVAMMRAEFIALEDKYALLEGKYNAAVGQNSIKNEPCDEYIDSQESAPNSTEQTPAGRSDLEIRIDPNDASQSPSFQASPIGVDVRPDPKLSAVTFQTPTRLARHSTVRDVELSEPSQAQPEPVIDVKPASFDWRPDR